MCHICNVFEKILFQFGPLNMSVAKGDIHADLKRKAVFDDNMDVVLEMISRVHKRIYDVKDFDMVCSLLIK